MVFGMEWPYWMQRGIRFIYQWLQCCFILIQSPRREGNAMFSACDDNIEIMHITHHAQPRYMPCAGVKKSKSGGLKLYTRTVQKVKNVSEEDDHRNRGSRKVDLYRIEWRALETVIFRCHSYFGKGRIEQRCYLIKHVHIVNITSLQDVNLHIFRILMEGFFLSVDWCTGKMEHFWSPSWILPTMWENVL